MQKWLIWLLIMGMSIGLVAPAALAQTTNATVNTPFLNMRSGAAATFPIVATLPQGQTLTLTAREANSFWVLGTLPTGITGWLNASYLTTTINIFNLPIYVPAQVVAPVTVTGLASVNTSRLNLRSGPGANFSVLAKLSQGDVVTLNGRNGDARWLQVVTSNGFNGWLSARYLATTVTLANLPVVSGTGTTPGFVQPVPSGGSSAIVNTGSLNVRLGPGAGFGILTRLPQGTGVNMAGRSADSAWILVQLADGRTGWVSSVFLTTTYPVGNLPIKG